MRVKVAFLSFSGESTDSYLEWHRLDHMPQQFEIEGIVNAQRWRALDTDGPIRFLVQYLMTEPVEQTLTEFAALGRRMAEVGRFPQRVTSHLLGAYDVTGAAAAPRVQVSADVIPWRPNTGVYVIVGDAPGPQPQQVIAIDGVAGVWTGVTTARATNPMWTPGTRHVTICYLDGDPRSVLIPHGSAEFAGAFESTVRSS